MKESMWIRKSATRRSHYMKTGVLCLAATLKKPSDTLYQHFPGWELLFHNKKFPNSPLIAVGFPIHWSREGITTKACNKFRKPLNGLHAINPNGIHRYSWHTTHTPFLTLVADGLEGCFDNSESFQGVLGSQVKNHCYKTCIMYSAKTKSQEFCLFIGYHRKHTYQTSTQKHSRRNEQFHGELLSRGYENSMNESHAMGTKACVALGSQRASPVGSLTRCLA